MTNKRDGTASLRTAERSSGSNVDKTYIETPIDLTPDYTDSKLILDSSNQRDGFQLTIEATRSGTKHVVILNDPLIEFLLDDDSPERLMLKKFWRPTMGKIRSIVERPGRPGLPALTLGTRPIRYRKLADGTRKLALHTGPGLIALPENTAALLRKTVADLIAQHAELREQG